MMFDWNDFFAKLLIGIVGIVLIGLFAYVFLYPLQLDRAEEWRVEHCGDHPDLIAIGWAKHWNYTSCEVLAWSFCDPTWMKCKNETNVVEIQKTYDGYVFRHSETLLPAKGAGS